MRSGLVPDRLASQNYRPPLDKGGLQGGSRNLLLTG